MPSLSQVAGVEEALTSYPYTQGSPLKEAQPDSFCLHPSFLPGLPKVNSPLASPLAGSSNPKRPHLHSLATLQLTRAETTKFSDCEG